MVIEHAERFGLAQLHQLRGRIGRGAGHSTCLLLYKAPLGETAKARLKIMRETEDGFRIAEEDLRAARRRRRARHPPIRHAGLPGRPRRGARQIYRRGARRRRAGAGARPHPEHAARRGAAPAALSVRARRGGPADPRRAEQLTSLARRCGAAARRARGRCRRAPPASSADRCRPAAPCRPTSAASSRSRP